MRTPTADAGPCTEDGITVSRDASVRGWQMRKGDTIIVVSDTILERDGVAKTAKAVLERYRSWVKT